MLLADIALVVGAYLLGSLPYMILLGRARGIELSREEDLHMALWNKAGRLYGLSGVFVDALKGAIPVIVGFSCHLQLAVIAASAGNNNHLFVLSQALNTFICITKKVSGLNYYIYIMF